MLGPVEGIASAEPRIESRARKLTNQTFLANRNSLEPTRYSLEEICQLRWRFSIYFVIMEEWINFQLPAPIFGDILGGNSSSGGVNDQVRHVYTLKKSPISLSFVAYIPLKSTSEN